MKRNPLIPFLLIAVLGIGLMFLLSFKGLGDHKELAAGDEGEKSADLANATPEELYQQAGCIGCHGDNYEGVGNAPSLIGAGEKLGVDGIKKTIQEGRGGMPGGLIQDAEQLDKMAQWVSELK
ncbi:cytochrome c550 [Metabacillus malikii]|uniref:Cytochrome c550 n=1 Tax=Metabacillus malikii TaxID=1504265 RepID=A0ABT9ZH43_9BACI|nr:cytochrome c [Metabacillus malikii]MDQ0231613.1 cytochrome c550 [Metabacillus malikii]